MQRPAANNSELPRISQEAEALLAAFRKTLRVRGLNSVTDLVHLFKKFDLNNDGTLQRGEIEWLIKKKGFEGNKSEADIIFEAFDANGDGVVSLSEFIQGLRGKLPQSSLDSIHQTWDKISPDSDEITVSKLKHLYQTTDKSEGINQVMKAMDTSKDGKIQRQEFIDYYCNLSIGFDSDLEFTEYLKASWNTK